MNDKGCVRIRVEYAWTMHWICLRKFVFLRKHSQNLLFWCLTKLTYSETRFSRRTSTAISQTTKVTITLHLFLASTLERKKPQFQKLKPQFFRWSKLESRSWIHKEEVYRALQEARYDCAHHMRCWLAKCSHSLEICARHPCAECCSRHHVNSGVKK